MNKKKNNIAISKEIIDYLAEKYSAINDKLLAEIEYIINIAIKALTGEDIEYYYDESVFYIYDHIGEPYRRYFVYVNLKLLYEILQRYLFNIEASKIYKIYLKYSNSLIYGKVSKILSNGDWVIEFVDDYSGLVLMATCKVRDQMVTEREQGHLFLDKDLFFYVKRIDANFIDGIMHIDMHVSRSSISLLRLLLKKKLTEAGIDANIQIKMRVAGRNSKVYSDIDIPKQIIADVSKLLNKEAIIVRKKKREASFIWYSA